MLEDETNYETILDCMKCVEELYKLCHDVIENEIIIFGGTDKDIVAQLGGVFFLLQSNHLCILKCDNPRQSQIIFRSTHGKLGQNIYDTHNIEHRTEPVNH